jgi:hypothetical protein
MRDPQFNAWVDRARAVPLEREIERRGIKLKREGAERVGPCPKCGGDDRFAVNVKKNVFNCRGCGIAGDIIAFVEQLDGVDFPTACATLTGEPPPKPNGKANSKDRRKEREKVVAEYPYCDEAGDIVFVVERREFQNADGTFVIKDGKRKKSFRQKRPDPDHPGRWINNVEGVRTIPYRLPQLIEAIALDHPVLIVEGERKAELLAGWNIAATCNAGGAKKWKPEHAAFLKDADVVLVPDRDDAGFEHIHLVGVSLVGTAKRIRVLVLPGLRPKGDIVDWVNAGGTPEQLGALLNEAQEWKPPPTDEINKQDEAKAKAKAREDELIANLAKIQSQSPIEYDREKRRVADELKVSRGAIDAEVRARREGDARTAPLYGHWEVEPWPEPVDGDCLLRDINARIRRHVVCPLDASLTCALWIMLSWVHNEVAVHSPILLVTSHEAMSGKTTLLGITAHLARRAINSVDISKAALYRSIQRWEPSFVIDEFDTVLAAVDGDRAELKSVINTGHTRGSVVIRCITDEHTPEPFSTFAPKAIGMIGRKMPYATLTRCLVVQLQRRKSDEPIERFLHIDDPGLADLRRRLLRWSLDNVDSLHGEPSMPPQFDNRMADNWRVLFAIADLCSGVEDWGDKARQAAINIEGQTDITSDRTRLLADIKRIFDVAGLTGPKHIMLSKDLVAKLKEIEEAPWAEWKGKGLTQNSLAELLGGGGGRGRNKEDGFNIRSRTVHPKEGPHGKGYRREQFEDAWSRYVLPDEPDEPDDPSLPGLGGK